MQRILPILLIIAAACAHGPTARSDEPIPFRDDDRAHFSKRVKVLKVLAYTDKQRNKVAPAQTALPIIRKILGDKGYQVELVSNFRSAARLRPTPKGYRTSYHLVNDSMLRPHEGYVEVYIGEQLWEDGKPFTDYTEVGRIEESGYGQQMVMVKVPNLEGHKNVRRSVETEVFLFRRGRSECVYQRASYVQERDFNHHKALAMAFAGIPKRK